MTVCAVAMVADAQVRLSCGPAGRGRAAADGAHCECVAPLFAERVVAGVRRCVPTPAPARLVVRPRVELTCPAGEHRSDDHCCAAGHAWVREMSRCVCVDTTTCASRPTASPETGASPVQRHAGDDVSHRAASDHPATTVTEANADELPERPTRGQITSVLSGLNNAVRTCTNGQMGTAPVAVVIRNDGLVMSARVSGLFAGTAAGECISAVVSRAQFPRFRGNEIRITYPYVVQPPL